MKIVWRTIVRGAYKLAGRDSPYSAEEYGTNWTNQRKKRLEKDNRTCQVCGTTQEELGRKPSVHHVTPRSSYDGTPDKMNAIDNLVTLCPECHGEFEGEYENCTSEEFIQKAREEKD